MKYLKPLGIMLITIWIVFVVLRWLDLMDTYRSGTWALQFWTLELNAWVRYVGTPWFLGLWIFLTGYVIGCWILGFLQNPPNIFRSETWGLHRWTQTSGTRWATHNISDKDTCSIGTTLDDDLIALALGVGVLSTITYVFGLAGALLSVVFLIMGLMVCSAGFRHVGRLLHRLRQSIQGIPCWKWHDKVLLGVIVWYIARTCLVVCNPATGWDECNSHLAMAKWFVREGGIEFLPWMNFNNFPMGLESLLMLQFMGTETPGAVIPYVFHLLTLCVVYLLGIHVVNLKAKLDALRKLVSFHIPDVPIIVQPKRTGGLLACVIYLMIPATTMYSQAVLTDSMLTFYACLLGWYAVSNQNRGVQKYLMLGLLSGILISIKYTGIIWLVVVLPVILLTAGENRLLSREYLLGVGMFLLALLLMSTPWIIRNFALFGNPVFPFLNGWFPWMGTGTIAPHLRADLVISHGSMLDSFRVQKPLIAAWMNTMQEHGAWIQGIKPGSSGPWLLALVPVVALCWRSLSVGLRWLVVASLLYLAVWWWGLRINETRYLLPAVPALCAAAGVGISRLLEGDDEV